MSALPTARQVKVELTVANSEHVKQLWDQYDIALQVVSNIYLSLPAHEKNVLKSKFDYINNVYRFRERNSKWKYPFRVPAIVVRNGQHVIRMTIIPQHAQPLNFTDVPPLRENIDKIYKPCGVAIGPTIETSPYIAAYRSNTARLAGGFKRVWHSVNFNRNLIDEFEQFVGEQLLLYEPISFTPPSHEFLDKWLDNSKYTLKEKAHYHQLFDEYDQIGHPWNKTLLNNIYREKIYHCGTFIKKEFLSEEKYPRLINPRPDDFKVLVAPYIKEIEHRMIYNKHFIKGKLPHEVTKRMKQIQSNYKNLYETDYSSFEGSFSKYFQNACERQLFRYMLKNNPEIAAIVDECYVGKNVLILGEFKDKVEFEGSRMSGDMWTSLCNGVTNMFLFKFCVMKTQTNTPKLYDYIFEGDDGFIGTNFKLDMNLVSQLGFTLKILNTGDPNELSFCGHRYSPDGTHFVDFWNQIIKFGWSFDPVVLSKYGKYTSHYESCLMRARALSLIYNCGGMPILQELCLKIIALTEGCIVKKHMFDRWLVEQYHIDEVDHLANVKPVSEIARCWFSDTFGITIKDQIELEKDIKRQTTLRFTIPLWLP